MNAKALVGVHTHTHTSSLENKASKKIIEYDLIKEEDSIIVSCIFDTG